MSKNILPFCVITAKTEFPSGFQREKIEGLEIRGRMREVKGLERRRSNGE